MANNLPAMSGDFLTWYRSFSLADADENEQAQNKWNSVAALAASADENDVEALVRIAFATKQKPDQRYLDSFRAALQAADKSPTTQNDREVEVMAAVVLTILFENVAEDISAVAALKVSTASFGRHRKTNLPLDLEQLAENALIKISHFDRKRPDLAGLLESASLTVDIEDAIKQLPQAFNHEVVGQALKTLANRITKSFAHLSEIVGAADRFFHIQDEELQILSWFLVGRSKLLDCDFSDIKPDEQPLIFATELAELVSYMPGPLAVRSILARVGLKERKKLSVPQVINAANAEMMTKIMENVVPSPITQPMHFAISRKLETGDEESWVSNWAAVTGIDAKSTLSPLEVAVLFYRERLLNRG